MQQFKPFMLNRMAQMTGNQNMIKQTNKLIKVEQRGHQIQELFKYFILNEQVYEQKAVFEMMQYLQQFDCGNSFLLDVKQILWHPYFQYYLYGIKKYCLKEKKVDPPSEVSHQDVFYSDSTFNDISFAYYGGKQFTIKSPHEYRSEILGSNKVRELMNKMAQEDVMKKGISFEKALKAIQKEANHITKEMFSTMNFPVIRIFCWFLQKTFKQIYEKIVLDKDQITMFEQLESNFKGPLIFIPTHRSYIDFLIVSYLTFIYKLKIPYIAAGIDFLSIFMVNHLLRSSGAFYMRRSFKDNPLYTEIFRAYVQQLVMEQNNIEFFIEGTRSRSGKMMAPKFGILNMVTDLYFQKKVPNLNYVPIALNYERVLEGETFPFELLGEQKVKESFGRIIKAVQILNISLGRIYIQIQPPIVLELYTNKFLLENPQLNPFENLEHRKQLSTKLGFDIVYSLMNGLVVLPTNIVASILLMHRKGIQEDRLIEMVQWLCQQLILRGIKIGSVSNVKQASGLILSAVAHLGGSIQKSRKDIFEISMMAKTDFKNILLLMYYKNVMIQPFVLEAFCACALSSFGHQLGWKDGTPIQRLFEEYSFLMSLCQNEFVIKEKLNNFQSFQKFMSYMEEREIFKLENDKVKVHEKGNQMMGFLCSLIWPLIECYWMCSVYIFSLKNKNSNIELPLEKLIHQIQWFAEQLYEERVIQFYESCSQDMIKNCINSFKKMKIISISQNSKKQDVIELQKSNDSDLKELGDQISRFMKDSFSKSLQQPIDIARQINLLDYALMSKL